MDYEKKIQNLQFENEFLQQQIEELNEMLLQKDTDSSYPKNVYNSEGWLRSQMECNLIEMQQLQYKMDEAAKKAAAIEFMNESLENDLLTSYKAHQKDKTIIKSLTSEQVHHDIINEELNQTSALFKKVKLLKSEYAALKSEASNTHLENQVLQHKLDEANALIQLYKNKIAIKSS